MPVRPAAAPRPDRSSARSPSTCRRRHCGPERCGGRSRRAAGRAGRRRGGPARGRARGRARLDRAAAAGRGVRPVGRRRRIRRAAPGDRPADLSCTTGTTGAPASPSADSGRAGMAGQPPRRSQLRMPAAARHASSRQSAGTATSRWPSAARSRCWTGLLAAAAQPGPGRSQRSAATPDSPRCRGRRRNRLERGDPRRGGERGSPMVRPRGGRAGSVPQESLGAVGQVTSWSCRAETILASPYAAGTWADPSRPSTMSAASLTWTKRSSPGRAHSPTGPRFTGMA